jgi:glycosyltransferase involved in cell wall biosynthesis
MAQALRAMAACKDLPFRLDVVGRADPGPFMELTTQLGLTTRVHHHGSSNDVGRYMAAADLFVLPTQYEPFGLVIVEALASGLPTITSRLAGAAEAVRHGSNGLLLDDPLDVEELASHLRTAASADLAEWSASAAASVHRFRIDQTLPRVEHYIRNGVH